MDSEKRARWARVGQRSLMAALVVLTCACGGGIEKIGLEVTVEGDRVTIDWDGRPVHDVEVANPSEGYRTYWWVSVADVPVSAMPPRNTEPAIVPPIVYGEPVENAFPTTAQPLVRGNTYDVSVDVFGWDDTCKEHGQDDPNELEYGCTIAAERVQFTY